MNRKEFLQKSLFGAATVAVGASSMELLTSCAPEQAKNTTELRLSFQEGIAPGESLNEKFDFMENLGIVGFEPGGGNLAGCAHYGELSLRVPRQGVGRPACNYNGVCTPRRGYRVGKGADRVGAV